MLAILNTLLQFFLKYPWRVLFGIACVVIFLMDTYRPTVECPECPECPTIETQPGDSISLPDTVYIPTPVWRDTGSIKWRWHDIDTNAILALFEDYYITRFYSDTLLNDSTGFVLVMDSVSENKIQSREINKFFTPIVTTIIKPAPKVPPVNILYIGAGAGGWSDKFGVSGKISILNKKQHIQSISFDPINKYLEVSHQIPIKLRKR